VYRIETERLVIRCYELSDAPLLGEAVEASRAHLAPWMPWAGDQDTSIDASYALVRRFRGKFDLDEDFGYAVLPRDEGRVLGSTGLHPRLDELGREIGYWVRHDELRKGYATELTAALTRVGFEHLRLDRIQVLVEPENAASTGVPRKLGFRSEGLRRRDRPGSGGRRMDLEYWTLHADEYPDTPSAAVRLRALDVLGHPLLESDP
jgi:RimJ/RimL family protein N-acetyltransferase